MLDNFTLQRCIRDMPGLTMAERYVAFILTTYRNAETGACFPSQQMIATKAGVSLRYVNQIVKSLKQKKVLTTKKQRFVNSRKKTVTNYTFLLSKIAKNEQ